MARIGSPSLLSDMSNFVIRSPRESVTLVRAVAQLHGGTAEAQSEAGKGTTISVILPILQEN